MIFALDYHRMKQADDNKCAQAYDKPQGVALFK